MNLLAYAKLRATRLFAITLLGSLLLLSCGGGGNSSSPQPIIQTVSASIQYDAAVPAAAINNVSQIVSPLGASSAGNEVSIPKVSSGEEAMLLTSDSNNNIMLATIGTSSTITFSAESTAVVLVRLGLGPLPNGVSGNQVNSAIQSTAEFPNLVLHIGQSLDAGTSPTTSTAVLQSVVTVISQLDFTSPVSIAAQLSGRTLAQPSVNATTPPPYTIYKNSFSIEATGTNGTGGVMLTNSFPIQWTASSNDASTGLQILGDVQLPELPLTFSSIVTINKPKPVSVPGNGNEFNLTISQSNTSKAANLISLASNVTSIVLDLGLKKIAGPCVAPVTQAILGSNLEQLVNQPSADGMWRTIISGIDPKNIGKAIVGCATFPMEPAIYLQLVFNYMNQLTITYKAVNTAFQAGTLVAQISQLAFYWNSTIANGKAISVGVCVGVRPGETATNIVNCAKSLEITPANPQLNPGDTLQLSVSARDAAGNPTATPTGLEWTSTLIPYPDSSSVATVDSNGLVTAIAASNSPVRIIVTDPGSGAFGESTVEVVNVAYVYTSDALLPSGTSVPVPGPVTANVKFALPIPQDFSGTLGPIHIANVTLQSNGVGALDLAGTQLYGATEVTFLNGSIISWWLSSGLIATGASCSARTNWPNGPSTIPGYVYVAIGTGGGYSGPQHWLQDGASARCIGTIVSPITGQSATVDDIYISGSNSPNPANWVLTIL